jgi:hypothetical protein
MKVKIKLKPKIKFGADEPTDQHTKYLVKRLSRNRFYQRQLNMPDPE